MAGLRERLEEMAGVAVRPYDDTRVQEATSQQYQAFVDEAEDLAIHALGYIDGRPHEMRADRRRELSQRSRVAYLRDPLAGAEGDMRANFAFGRGVSKPTAKEPEVQKVIDRFWNDPINKKKLTSFEAQRLRSNDLLAQGNLFAGYFEENGRIRVAFLDADLVTDVVVSNEDDELSLWYAVRKKKREWDFNRDGERPVPFEIGGDGLARTWYYRHWRNVDLAEAEAAEAGESFTQKPPDPKLAEGRVEHFRINRVGRTQFGVPPWARVLRYFSAMNQFNEARVSMAQAAASIIAKRVIRGGPKGVVKAASNVLSQAGELAQARFRSRRDVINPTSPGTNPSKGFAPPPPGSIWTENESDSLTAMNLNSGGAAAAADQQILMAPIAAASQFGTHYYGNLQDAGLASATTVELPTLMNVSSWQEMFEQILRFYLNRSIQAAVRAGHLGGMISEGEDDGRPLNTLVYEEDREEMERRTGKDLTYSFSMPYPGRRNLPDVINTVATAVETYDPEGRNPWLRRYFMEFLLQTLEVEEPAAALDLFLKLPDGMDEAPPELSVEPFAQMVEPTEPNPDGVPEGGNVPSRVPRGGKPSEQQSQNGERRASTPPKREMGGKGGGEVQEELVEDAAADLSRALAGDADAEFEKLIADPAAFLAGRGPVGKAAMNGHGS